MLTIKKIFVNEPEPRTPLPRPASQEGLTSAGRSSIFRFVMISNTNAPRDILAGHGVKPTFQRLTILGAVRDNRSHLTIRALHAALVRKIPTLSKTTLYSTLGLFAAKGLVRALTIDPAEVRYDGVPAPHHHFYCTACGRILDIDISCVTGRAGEIHGHRIDEVHGYFKGVCRDCRANDGRSAVFPNRNKRSTPRRRDSHA
jgi:Fur family peroxide stress response transcriptional regulator